MRDQPEAERWTTRTGLGSCFHQALSRWTLLHQRSSRGWRVAVGIVNTATVPEFLSSVAIRARLDGVREFPRVPGTRNVHAWLERGNEVLSAVNGELWDRELFYIVVNVERESVRRINPRRIVRQQRIGRGSVDWLLRQWGGRFKVTPEGGIIAE